MLLGVVGGIRNIESAIVVIQVAKCLELGQAAAGAGRGVEKFQKERREMPERQII